MRLNSERGFTLAEIMTALAILAILLPSLATLAFQISQGSLHASTNVRIGGTAIEQTGLLTAISFDSLASQAGCTSVTTPSFPHERCVAVDSLSPKQRRITIIISPADSHYAPDSVAFLRWRLPFNPFNTSAGP